MPGATPTTTDMPPESVMSITLRSAGIAALLLTAGLDTAAAQDLSQPYDRLYWGRPHNTYERSHFARLTDAFDGGYRVVELDVYPAGGVTSTFHVKHNPTDSNTGNNCKAGAGGGLGDCLDDIVAWSNAHPGHAPIGVQLDLKADWLGDYILGGGDRGNQLQVARNLNALIKNKLGAKLYTPPDLRIHTGYSSLREGVYRRGWPAASALTGRIIVYMMGGLIGDKNDTQEEYVEANNWGYDSAIFVCPNAGSEADFQWNGNANDFDDSRTNQWVVCGNVQGSKYWYKWVRNAYASRQLVNLWDVDADQYHLMWLAAGWGASMIDRDATTAWSRLPLNGTRRSVPTEFRIQNVNSGKCAGLEGSSYSDGTRIKQYTCSTSIRQYWVYSDETQFRVKGDDAQCFDIKDAHNGVGNGDDNHIWDCDGGTSEKWKLQPDGSILSEYGYCLDVTGSGTGEGVQYQIYSCNGSNAQRFNILN